MQLILKHPEYQRMVSTKSPEYYTFVSLRGVRSCTSFVVARPNLTASQPEQLATQAKEPNDQVVRWLEEREAKWTLQHGDTGAVQEGRNGEKRAEDERPCVRKMRIPSDIRVLTWRRRFEPLASSSRPAPQKTPSFPTATLADRLAALRASGLPGATSNGAQAAPPSRPPPPLRPTTPPRQPSSRTLRQSAVPLSPTSSPRAQTGDLVADDAVERTGSAPPILPMSNVQEPATVWENSSLQFRQEGGTPIADAERGVTDRGPAGGVGIAPEGRGALSDLSDLPSPTRFMSAFPSVDDLERRVEQSRPVSDPSASSSSFAFPSVPSHDPSAAPTSPARPAPPAPRTVSGDSSKLASPPQSDFARLAADFDRASLSRAQKRRSRDDVPPALQPGGGQQPHSASVSSSAPSPSSPLPPPSAASKSFKIPFAAEIRPLELWQYIQTAKGETGHGPRVLLLDVRSRDEYERGRIRGETVCLEPLALRDGCILRHASSPKA